MNVTRPWNAIEQSRAGRWRVAAVLTCLAIPTTAWAINKSWNTGNGNWSFGPHWSPAGAPLAADVAYVGNLASAENATVGLSQEVSVAGLHVSDGMVIHNNTYYLNVNGNTTLTGSNTVQFPDGYAVYGSGLWIEDIPIGASFATDNITVSDEAFFHIAAGAYALVDGVFNLGDGCRLAGEGLISFQGTGTTFINDGYVSGQSLTLNQLLNGLYDLDGLTGTGGIHLAYPGTGLSVFGSGLSDTFGGWITLGPGSVLNMQLANAWTADANATIDAPGDGTGLASELNGTAFSLAGEVTVLGDSGYLQVNAPTTIQPTADILVSTDDRAEFGATGAATTIQGGQFTVWDGAQLDFNGPTTVLGGAFSTESSDVADGSVDFGGDTTWNGNVSFEGAARQSGLAEVTGATTINADTFDMDGSTGTTTWDVFANFAVNADTIDTSVVSPNRFDGTINVHGGFIPRLTINFTNPGTAWHVNGSMNLSGLTTLWETRVAGSHMHVNGNLSVTGGKVHISADTTFEEQPGGCNVNIGPATAALRFGGTTFVGGGTVFSGMGILQNAASGHMTLRDGVSMMDVGLVNQGDLMIRRNTLPDLAGLVSVDRFTSENAATLQIRIGGYTLGLGHDHMVVTGGPAVLDGTLDVQLFDAGGIAFVPQIGDQFTILTAVGGVSGTFDVVTSACAGGNNYQWSVLYGPNDVTLQLGSISLVPGDMNCDCAVNGLDIQPFVFALLDPGTFSSAYPGCDILHGDISADGSVNFGDYAPFVQLLLASP